MVRKPGKGAETPHSLFARRLARHRPGSVPPPAWFKQLALLFIEDNLTYRMPGELEPTFAALYST